MRIQWGILAASVWVAAGVAHGATVPEALSALAGDWQGVEVAPIGHVAGSFHLTLTPVTPAVPGAVVLGKARIGDAGDGLLAAADYDVVLSGGQVFAAMPGEGMGEGAFAIEHSPFGGLRFHRLAKAAAPEGQVAVQAEEIILGKAAADGSRRLKIARGEKLCRDTAGQTTVCGAPETRTYTVKR